MMQEDCEDPNRSVPIEDDGESKVTVTERVKDIDEKSDEQQASLKNTRANRQRNKKFAKLGQTQSGEFLCDICDRKFEASRALKRHKRTHHGNILIRAEISSGVKQTF